MHQFEPSGRNTIIVCGPTCQCRAVETADLPLDITEALDASNVPRILARTDPPPNSTPVPTLKPSRRYRPSGEFNPHPNVYPPSMTTSIGHSVGIESSPPSVPWYAFFGEAKIRNDVANAP